MLSHNLYSQNDPRWKDMLLGTSKATVGSYGCLVVSITNALANYSIDKAEKDGDLTPKELVTRLNEGNCFQLTGDLSTEKVGDIIPSLYRLERKHTDNYPIPCGGKLSMPVTLAKIRRLLTLGNPVIIHIDATKYDGNPFANHFVLVVDNDWTIVDPWDGVRVKLQERYGQPDKTIQGYLAYIGSPTSDDTSIDKSAGMAAFKLSQVLKSREFAATNFPLKFYVKEALEHLING